ncbi:MAG: DinB family protein [Saprospiraceae bacterium]|nr:DinB family protein [Saprospiraceae bacterium]
MDKQQIIEQLRMHHSEFGHLLTKLSSSDYLFAPEHKWNAGQHLEHICKSVTPVKLAFTLPGFLLRILFGKANRPSRDYAYLIEKYQAKLAAGGRATGQFIPGAARYEQRDQLLRKLNDLVEGLCRKVASTSDYQLDTLILPHPLLGKLTLREMLYFTIYHVQHHQAAVLRGLPSTN